MIVNVGQATVEVAGITFSSENVCFPRAVSVVSGNASPQVSLPTMPVAVPVSLPTLLDADPVSLPTLLQRFESTFASGKEDFGSARVEPLSFDVEAERPVRRRPYRLSRPEAQFVADTIQRWLDAGRIRPSTSHWAAPAHVVPKDTDPFMRLVIDFTGLNACIPPDNQPPPLARDIFDSLHGATLFTKLDFKDAYLQIPVAEECRQFLSFVVEGAQYEFCYVPFGLNVAGGKLQRELNTLFRGLDNVAGYADDWIVFSTDMDTHLQTLTRVFERVAKAGFLLSRSKCVFAATSIEFLGRRVSADGVELLDDDVCTIRDWPNPANKADLHKFLGLAQWCAEFLPGFSDAVAPLRPLLRDGVRFDWSAAHDAAFRRAKALTLRSLTLAFPDFSKQFVLEVDASSVGFGAVLIQGDRAVRLAQRKTTPAESALPPVFLELSAVVWAVSYFHVYLHGAPFLIITDHRALEWLTKLKNPTGKLALWALNLAPYRFEIKYRPGVDNTAADALSRRVPAVSAVSELPVLPTATELREAQAVDVACRRIAKGLAGDAAKPKGDFVLDVDGVLCLLTTRYTLPVLRPVVPLSLTDRILAHVHVKAGHLSVDTVRMTRESFFWQSLNKDTERFCRECLSCQQRKSPRGPRQIPAGTVTVSAFNDLLAMDILGGFPASPDGYNYLLVMTEYFTRYTVAAPLKTKTCAEVAAAFTNSWLLPFGAPKRLLSDQGGEFSGEPLTTLLRTHQVQKDFTTSYHPQTDGVVERNNQTLSQILSGLVGVETRAWVQKLPAALVAFNAAISASTGHAPYFLMFGRPSPLPTIVQPVAHSGTDAAKAAEHAHQARNEVKAINERRQAVSDLRNANLKRPVAFKVGDLVMVRDPRIRQAAFSKLDKQWVGPCRIHMKKSATLYYVKQQPVGYAGTVNVCNLKPYHGPPPRMSDPTLKPAPHTPTTINLPVTLPTVHRPSQAVVPVPTPALTSLPSPAPPHAHPVPALPQSPRASLIPLPLHSPATPVSLLPRAVTPAAHSSPLVAQQVLPDAALRLSMRSTKGVPPDRLGF
jgi:hypothetical protein